MKPVAINPCRALKGRLYLPGDKSIAHRAIILASLSKGNTVIRNFPFNDDCLSTISIFRQLGISISITKSLVRISGKGLRGLKKPSQQLFVNESGTTFRLMMGVLCGQGFKCNLFAGRSLSRRPMSRVLVPLRMMGAQVYGKTPAYRTGRGARGNEEYPPVTINGTRNLKGIRYKMPVASAQVKSAILLAGMYARSRTEIIEQTASRDHTERMLALFKAPIAVKNKSIVLREGTELTAPPSIAIPGDISSAAFFMVAATIIPGSSLTIKNVSLNPCRRQVIDLLKKMGARIKVVSLKTKAKKGEPSGDVIIKSSALRAAQVKKDEIPPLIDELPVLMVAACFARGRTVFKGVSELRVKETDRINSMVSNLKKMGARIWFKRDGLASECIVVEGPSVLRGARVSSFGDHRTAMSMIVAGLGACGRSEIDDVACIDKSFPHFIPMLKKLYK